jgi:hypothetical protein
VIDISKAKADAEEGLAIAEKATEGPWTVGVRQVNDLVAVGDPTDYVIAGASLDDDSAFIADARTRVPLLAANVLALKAEVDRLRAELAQCKSESAQRYRDEALELGSR